MWIHGKQFVLVRPGNWLSADKEHRLFKRAKDWTLDQRCRITKRFVTIDRGSTARKTADQYFGIRCLLGSMMG